MKKVICMIPARLGSKRIKFKNIRYLGNKLLIEHIITTAKEIFDSNDIYLNASEDIFEEIAERNEIQFYRRPSELSSDEAVNDDFLYDFLKHHECEWVLQAHSTSPFISKVDFEMFINIINDDGIALDSLFSVETHQIGALREESDCIKPINFVNDEKIAKSQMLKPIYTFCNGLMAFKRNTVIRNYEENSYCLFSGKYAVVKLEGVSTLDIDIEDDFRLAEAIWEAKQKPTILPHYFEIGMEK